MTTPNLQVISGVLQLNRKEGKARVEFSGGKAFGDASLVELRGSGRDFRFKPHAIVSPTNLTLSTHDNTHYRVDRSVDNKHLDVNWKIDANDLNLQIDFLVIGEV